MVYYYSYYDCACDSGIGVGRLSWFLHDDFIWLYRYLLLTSEVCSKLTRRVLYICILFLLVVLRMKLCCHSLRLLSFLSVLSLTVYCKVAFLRFFLGRRFVFRKENVHMRLKITYGVAIPIKYYSVSFSLAITLSKILRASSGGTALPTLINISKDIAVVGLLCLSSLVGPNTWASEKV